MFKVNVPRPETVNMCDTCVKKNRVEWLSRVLGQHCYLLFTGDLMLNRILYLICLVTLIQFILREPAHFFSGSTYKGTC